MAEGKCTSLDAGGAAAEDEEEEPPACSDIVNVIVPLSYYSINSLMMMKLNERISRILVVALAGDFRFSEEAKVVFGLVL